METITTKTQLLWNGWNAYNIAPIDQDDDSYKDEIKRMHEKSDQEMAGYSKKDITNSSTSAMRSFDINTNKACITALANIRSFFLFLKSDEKSTSVLSDHLLSWSQPKISSMTSNTSMEQNGATTSTRTHLGSGGNFSRRSQTWSQAWWSMQLALMPVA